MKRTLYVLLAILTLVMSSCGNDDDDNVAEDQTPKKVILVYMTAENNLHSYGVTNLKSILSGSKQLDKNTKVVAFVDLASKTRAPYISCFSQGTETTQHQYDDDFYSIAPNKMKEILQQMITDNPADEYSLIVWGHGSGPLITEDTIAVTTKSYGYDNGINSTDEYSKAPGKWINIPTMRTILESLKKTNGETVKFKILFFDACCMQNIEVAYELRNTAEYIVGSQSETPAYGYDYANSLSYFELAGEEGVRKMVDRMYEYCKSLTSYSYGLNCSAVRTSALDDFLTATRNALFSISNGTSPLEVSTTTFMKGEKEWNFNQAPEECVYYAKTDENCNTAQQGKFHVLHEMKDVMKSNLTDAEYEKWETALQNVIVEKRYGTDIRYLQGNSKPWMSDLIQSNEWYKFYIGEETVGGLSMLFPSKRYKTMLSPNINKSTFAYEWWQKVGWHELGW